MRRNNIWEKVLVCVFPVILLSLVYVFRESISHLGTLFPPCPSYTWFNIYCPGCGNTRSVQHLLTGDVAGSIRYNPVPVLGLIIILLSYIELITYVFGRHIKIMPRSKSFWKIFTILICIYFIVRNFIRPF